MAKKENLEDEMNKSQTRSINRKVRRRSKEIHNLSCNIQKPTRAYMKFMKKKIIELHGLFLFCYMGRKYLGLLLHLCKGRQEE